ncbi:murein hydrolase activator EnvC family protein [Novilysobacter antarcticus]|uniref:murein hydrolase activator EnvC family protein n=1 Tax=Novilysobacter antarcticus TaxID=2862543 RepID=UPI001C991692|nr:peptidoglycan DD-metalloendopeptidase family protein [Lysobacter antarcticus]
MRKPPASAVFALALMLLCPWPAPAQDRGDAERKLQSAKKELQAVASERREVEARRGAATRELRQADERVAAANRRLVETRQALQASNERMQQLQTQRAGMQDKLAGRRDELSRLLRAAYAQGDAAPLKVLLAQDRVADANRLLAYHRYLQADRAARIKELGDQLAGLDQVEREIVERRAELDAQMAKQAQQVDELEKERKERGTLVATLDKTYKDRQSREKALGRDVQGLEQVLKQLRAAAARAEAQRKAAAAKAEREARLAREQAKRAGQPAPTPAPARPAASASGPKVGGAGWPLSGSLIAGYGAKLPDGRPSQGMLIGANAGTSVQAVADGTVVYAEWMSGFGLILIIDHGNGYMSLYAHNDAVLRDAGDAVRRGDPVSTVGTSGGHGRPALYFELRRNGEPVNPNVWLNR